MGFIRPAFSKYLMRSLLLDVRMGSYNVKFLGEREGYLLQNRIMAKERCMRTHPYSLRARRQ